MIHRYYPDQLTRADFEYLLGLQCDRWGIPVSDALHGTKHHQIAVRALVFKILHEANFSLGAIALASYFGTSGIWKCIRRVSAHESYLVAWRNGEKHPRAATRGKRKPNRRRKPADVPRPVPILIEAVPRVRRPMRAIVRPLLLPSSLPAPSKARLMGARA